MGQDVGVFEDTLHARGVGDEVRREVALVELHALDEFDVGLEALALFDGDHAVLADLVDRLGDDLADLLVLVGGAGADLGDLGRRGDLLGHLLELGDDGLDGLVDTALDLVGIGAGGDVLEAFGEDGLGVDGGGGGAVAGVLGALRGDLLDHLGADVLDRVFDLDLFGDGHAVFGDGGRAEGFFEDHDVPGRPERGADGLGEFVDPAADNLAGFLIKFNGLGSHGCVTPI